MRQGSYQKQGKARREKAKATPVMVYRGTLNPKAVKKYPFLQRIIKHMNKSGLMRGQTAMEEAYFFDWFLSLVHLEMLRLTSQYKELKLTLDEKLQGVLHDSFHLTIGLCEYAVEQGKGQKTPKGGKR